jgi:hypothetical protein
MEQNPNIDTLKNHTKQALEYMIQCSNIPDDELFKITLNFWHFFTKNLVFKVKPHILQENGAQFNGLNLNLNTMGQAFNASFL